MNLSCLYIYLRAQRCNCASCCKNYLRLKEKKTIQTGSQRCRQDSIYNIKEYSLKYTRFSKDLLYTCCNILLSNFTSKNLVVYTDCHEKLESLVLRLNIQTYRYNYSRNLINDNYIITLITFFLYSLRCVKYFVVKWENPTEIKFFFFFVIG